MSRRRPGVVGRTLSGPPAGPDKARPTAAVLVVAIMLAVAPASAHRVDEYLQATRLAIGVNRINIEIDLTPGVDIAPAAIIIT